MTAAPDPLATRPGSAAVLALDRDEKSAAATAALITMPGLMDTPMAIGGQSSAFGADPGDLRASRDRLVPFGRKQGTGWDTAYASLSLASDEARFVTGADLPVDGGQLSRVG